MLGNYLVEFYQALYSSSASVSPEDLDGLIQPCISEEENASLCATPSSSKIFAAIRKMNPYRASGPSNMTPLFFTSCWGIVGADILSMIQSFFFFLIGTLPPALNQTNLVLVPKKDQPIKASEYCPISLYNGLL